MAEGETKFEPTTAALPKISTVEEDRIKIKQARISPERAREKLEVERKVAELRRNLAA